MILAILFHISPTIQVLHNGPWHSYSSTGLWIAGLPGNWKVVKFTFGLTDTWWASCLISSELLLIELLHAIQRFCEVGVAQLIGTHANKRALHQNRHSSRGGGDRFREKVFVCLSKLNGSGQGFFEYLTNFHELISSPNSRKSQPATLLDCKVKFHNVYITCSMNTGWLCEKDASRAAAAPGRTPSSTRPAGYPGAGIRFAELCVRAEFRAGWAWFCDQCGL